MDNVTSLHIAGWLACAAFLVVFWNNVRKAIDREKDKPHPGDVQRDSLEKFVPKPEFRAALDELKVEDAKLHQRIGGVERGARAHTDQKYTEIQQERAVQLDKLNRQQSRFMFALGKIAEKLKVEIEPTE